MTLTSSPLLTEFVTSHQDTTQTTTLSPREKSEALGCPHHHRSTETWCLERQPKMNDANPNTRGTNGASKSWKKFTDMFGSVSVIPPTKNMGSLRWPHVEILQGKSARNFCLRPAEDSKNCQWVQESITASVRLRRSRISCQIGN